MTIYASKTAESMNTDPKPYVGVRGDRSRSPFVHRGEPALYGPRPEFTPKTTHEANPILLRFRMLRGVYNAHVAAPNWIRAIDVGWYDEYPKNQIDHARRVLSRLANPIAPAQAHA